MKTVQLPFYFVPASQPPEIALSQDILSHARDALDAVTVWCDSKATSHKLRLALIDQAQQLGLDSIRLPHITTLQDWVWQQSTPAQTIISETSKQLILVAALRQNRSFFQTHNLWQLAEELVSLFNECTLAQVPLDNGSAELNAILIDSYGEHAGERTHISRESEILYRLWLAYQQQIAAYQGLDAVKYYADYLTQPVTLNQHTYYLLNQHHLRACEASFLEHVANQQTLKIFYPDIMHTRPTFPHHPHCQFVSHPETCNTLPADPLDIIFNHNESIQTRIHALQSTHPDNPLAAKLALFKCTSTEAHVRAVCLQAKQWLLADKDSIAIVANDRLLIRRIRAVLEEEGIYASDLGGWSFSTTSAATSIETLIEAIDNNFNKASLLNLLGSPFLASSQEYLKQYYLFKRHLKTHRNLATDTLGTFRNIADHMFTTDTLAENSLSNPSVSLLMVLEQLAAASQELQTLRRSGEHKLTVFNQALLTLLASLSMQQRLAADAAGEQLLQVLDTANGQLHNTSLSVHWQEWRQWLRNILERHYFIPRNMDKSITLCGLEHIDQSNFEHVILAGVEDYRLLNRNNKRTFFNEKVRYELGLATTHQANAINFVRFRKLLERSQSMLCTAEIEQHGEPVALSPWIRLIELFMRESYQSDLDNTELTRLVEYQQNSAHDLALPPAAQPRPSSPKSLISQRFSATQYQSLINCPYQYFAKYMLQLSDETVTDDMQAADYGQFVHASLQAFYFGEQGADFAAMSHPALCELLTNISADIFTRSAFPATSQKAWLKKWTVNIPAYVDWAIRRQQHWQARSGEQSLTREFTDTLCFYGQLDRLDQQQDRLAVLDYKTGSIASQKSVAIGETVQLPFYTLLDSRICRSEYVSLHEREQVRSIAVIEGEQLKQLQASHLQRLQLLAQQLAEGHELPANGAQSSCQYCDYQGMCRKSHWNHSASAK